MAPAKCSCAQNEIGVMLMNAHARRARLDQGQNHKQHPDIGFIGLGNMGLPIAERILGAGFPLTVWSRRPETSAGIIGEGAMAACDPAALARTSDVIFLCVVDDADIEQTIDTMRPGLSPGSLIVILSTIHPDTCRALADSLSVLQVGLIDAPVSGGANVARAGKLTVMLGGSEADCARVMPLLDCFAGLIVRLGEIGAGQTAKLINNTVMTANLAVAVDARATADDLGLDVCAMDRILTASSGQSFAHDRLCDLPTVDAFAHGAALLAKDVGLLKKRANGQSPAALRLTDVAQGFLKLFEKNTA